MEGLHSSDPRAIGPYRTLSRLGSGALGVVYLVEDATSAQFALRLLPPEFADDRHLLSQFRSDVEQAQQVDGVCLARYVDADLDSDHPYLVTEYVEGGSLLEQVRAEGPLVGGQIVGLAVGLAEALVAMHAAGVVDGNLWPSNVLMAEDGPRVVDYGIVHTAADAPADVFSWGATVAYAATGRSPLGESGDPDLGGLAPELAPIVARALDPDPARRPSAHRVLVASAELAVPATLPVGGPTVMTTAALDRTWHQRTASADEEPTAAASKRRIVPVALAAAVVALVAVVIIFGVAPAVGHQNPAASVGHRQHTLRTKSTDPPSSAASRKKSATANRRSGARPRLVRRRSDPSTSTTDAALLAEPPAERCPWLTSTASPEARAAMVADRMTLAQLDDLIHRASGTYEGNTDPIPVLCVPALTLADGPEGVGGGVGAVTQLPAAVSAAATWDPGIVRKYGGVIGNEMAGKGIDVDLGPTVNIVRDPRWGRAFESYGEDPYLNGQMAAADINGVQGQGVISMVKHLAVYNQETHRNGSADDAIVSDRVIHEIYLPAFQAAIQQGQAGAVMCSFSTINGVPACQDHYLADILYGQWKFQGFVQSDNKAIHSMRGALNGGLVDMEDPRATYFGNPLETAISKGEVSIEKIRTMAERVLATMFRFGLFNRTATGNLGALVDTPAHAATARTVADEGTVLLKNSARILPLSSGVRSIAVLGDDAGPDAISSGDGSAEVDPPYVVTPDQGIAAAVGAGSTVTYSQGYSPLEPNGDTSLLSQAVAAAQKASVAVVFVGRTEEEGEDLPNIDLSPAENELIESVSRVNPNTIVVLNTGSAVTMPWLNSVKAVVEAWYPGQMDGNSIADILFGRVDPSGKLPVTFPESIADVPASTPAQWPGVDRKVEYSEGLLVGYRWYDAKGIQPLFPFGFGLSYTTFSLSNLQITGSSSPNTALASVDITNTGKVAGADTVQVYIGDPPSAGEPPEQLKGFERVSLAPGQSTEVTIPLGPSAFSIWDTGLQQWVETPGTYSVMVGDSSAHLPLKGAIAIG
jgi:beta-glucosidase